MRRVFTMSLPQLPRMSRRDLVGRDLGPPDIPHSYLFTAAGKLTPLSSHHLRGQPLPIALRITPPVTGWSGAQWKSGTDYFRGGGPPNSAGSTSATAQPAYRRA